VPPRSSRAALLALEQIGIKLGLDQTRALVAHLGRPDRAFPSVIVAGTNGKGSVTAMIERGLRAAGYRTGRFTSPHLVDLEERFAVNGEPITPGALDAAAARVLDAASHLPAPPSFFEATTALALDVFRDVRADVAVLEVGLGGRLDATNAVDATAAVITSVDFDHEQYLGHTLEAIAREKAGVIKLGAVVVLAANPPEVEDVVAAACDEAGASLVRAEDGVTAGVRMVEGRAHLTLTTPVRSYGTLVLSLPGRHQAANATTAIRLLELLASARGFELPQEAIATSVEDAVWPGRLETITMSSVEVLLDGAHNPAGARALADHVLDTHHRRLPMVVGTMRDKALDALVSALAPAASQFVFTAASTPRAATPIELSEAATRIAPNIPAFIEPEPTRAVMTAAAFGSPVVVAGSLYLAGEIRAARS
jgi:dihydrofolate synthase / folylpolyglutamate synthase